MKRDTIGKTSLELQSKQVDDTHSAHDQMQESLTDYDKNLYICVDRCKALFPDNFYVVVTIKKERLMQNVLRNYFAGRLTCPTPEYDQVVYRYNRKDESIRFLWVIPSKDACYHIRQNVLQLPEEERELVNFVLQFTDGSLLKLAKELNGEQIDSPLLITGE